MTCPQLNAVIRDNSAPAFWKSCSRNSEIGCMVPPATITDLRSRKCNNARNVQTPNKQKNLYLASLTISRKWAAGFSNRNFNDPRPTVDWRVQIILPSSQWFVSDSMNAMTDKITLFDCSGAVEDGAGAAALVSDKIEYESNYFHEPASSKDQKYNEFQITNQVLQPYFWYSICFSRRLLPQFRVYFGRW